MNGSARELNGAVFETTVFPHVNRHSCEWKPLQARTTWIPATQRTEQSYLNKPQTYWVISGTRANSTELPEQASNVLSDLRNTGRTARLTCIRASPTSLLCRLQDLKLSPVLKLRLINLGVSKAGITIFFFYTHPLAPDSSFENLPNWSSLPSPLSTAALQREEVDRLWLNTSNVLRGFQCPSLSTCPLHARSWAHYSRTTFLFLYAFLYFLSLFLFLYFLFFFLWWLLFLSEVVCAQLSRKRMKYSWRPCSCWFLKADFSSEEHAVRGVPRHVPFHRHPAQWSRFAESLLDW